MCTYRKIDTCRVIEANSIRSTPQSATLPHIPTTTPPITPHTTCEMRSLLPLPFSAFNALASFASRFKSLRSFKPFEFESLKSEHRPARPLLPAFAFRPTLLKLRLKLNFKLKLKGPRPENPRAGSLNRPHPSPRMSAQADARHSRRRNGSPCPFEFEFEFEFEKGGRRERRSKGTVRIAHPSPFRESQSQGKAARGFSSVESKKESFKKENHFESVTLSTSLYTLYKVYI